MPMATDSGTDAAGESRLSGSASPMATGGGCYGASDTPVVCACEGFDKRPRNITNLDEGSKPAAAPLWADLPADILGVVLGLIPCLADRASVRYVCRHWRAAACVQGLALPAPLPVLVLPRFRFSCLTSDGTLTYGRCALMPAEVAADDVQIVGSSDDWLMGMRPSRQRRHVDVIADSECFLVNAFSGEVVHLPRLRNSLHVDQIYTGTNERVTWLPSNGVLSASPSSESRYTVAALSCTSSAGCGLVLWQPGMTSWYFCRAQINTWDDDLAFYQGKLYMAWRFEPRIFAFDLREDEEGIKLSCAEDEEYEPLLPPKPRGGWMRCKMLVWRGKLLLIVRFFSRHTRNVVRFLSEHTRNVECNELHSVEVFALDLSTSPCGITQIRSFDGDCIFVDRYGCRSFSAGLHAGVQGDLIYFLDECISHRFPYTFVYSMRDGTARRFPADLLLPDSVVPKGHNIYQDSPVWIFPSS